MFKFTSNFFIFQLLVLTVNGADQNSLVDVESDVEASHEDVIEDLGTKRGQEIQRHPDFGYCPPGFTYLHAARSCYKAVFESHDWSSAIQKCNELRCGSHLAAITSATENNAVKTFLASELSRNIGNTACIPSEAPAFGNLFWTSGQQHIKNNCKSPYVWKISSGKELPFGFTSWHGGEPNCGSGDMCVHIWPNENFNWNDHYCNTKICPLCEYTL